MEERTQMLTARANAIRKNIVKMIGVDTTGHVGGSCSSADIVATLYFSVMKHDAGDPSMQARDRLILSKGHAGIVQYAALAEAGYFPAELLSTLKDLGSPLQGHPDIRKLRGIEATTGSLGQGVSIACGMAAALRLDGNPSRVFVLVGDGELAEGQLWEAFMSAANFKLDNLCVIVDRNCLQATGRASDRFPIERLDERFEAFGFAVQHVDGHDYAALLEAFERADALKGRPSVIIADTIKGKGISFAENVASFHNGAFTQEQFDMAMAELTGKEG